MHEVRRAHPPGELRERVVPLALRLKPLERLLEHALREAEHDLILAREMPQHGRVVHPEFGAEFAERERRGPVALDNQGGSVENQGSRELSSARSRP
ncbi:hypothetical protein GCM10010471_04620 [Leucobacter komagatae]